MRRLSALTLLIALSAGAATGNLTTSKYTTVTGTTPTLTFTNESADGLYELKEDKTYRITSKGKDVAVIKPETKISFPTNEPEKAFEILWKLFQLRRECNAWPGTLR